MLTQLNIQGLAIIDSLSIEFSHGFNVITGETGAGKSILIKALGFLLGAKASSETVRHGRDQATVSGLFDVPHGHPCGLVLENYGIESEHEASSFAILVRRTVNSKGRSLAWINDMPVTATVLRELALTLIDVFGQHENLRLLDSVQHISCLDQFLRDRALPSAYAEEYRAVHKQVQSLIGMIDGFRTKQRDADYLLYRCNELRTFSPSREDYNSTHDLCLRAGHIMTLAKGLEEAQACIDQGANGESLSHPLWEASRILGRISTIAPDLGIIAELANQLAHQVDDLGFQLGKSFERLEINDEDIETGQARLAGYQELFRKLAVTDIDSLVNEHERLEAELTFLESASVDVSKRLSELEISSKQLANTANQLSVARKSAKGVVKRRIEAELHELAMPGAKIDVDLSSVHKPLVSIEFSTFGSEAEAVWARVSEILSGLGEHGAEKAQLLLAANPGEPLLPLQKIASGGEISRVMLALKKALAAGADTCILVFDEIDTGISGRVAAVVGRKMQELSGEFQVICISHLAQVAAHADAHFLVHKLSRDKRTESTISRLSPRSSEEELARLLSGEELTPSSLANARALVKKAKEKTV